VGYVDFRCPYTDGGHPASGLHGAFHPFHDAIELRGVLAISKELEESAFVAGASGLEMFRRVFVPLMLPAMFAGWQYSFLQTARELPVALLLQSEGNKMVSVWIWNLWEVGQVTNAAALSVVVAVLVAGLGWGFDALSRRVGITSR
jgi:iron(III) transport system permease protein